MNTVHMSAERVQFFISYAGPDRAWAEWVAWHVEDAGYAVELDKWHWLAGQNFVTSMSDALDRCDWVIALYSTIYFERSRFTTIEWTQAIDRLIPIRIESVPITKIPAVLRRLIFVDVFDMTDEQARRALITAVTREPQGTPVVEPLRPDGSASRSPRRPGSLPAVWNIRTRNPEFVGREEVLFNLRQTLTRPRPSPLTLYGMPGSGKTEIAIEYAHRFAGWYELAWWVPSEQSALIGQEFAKLGRELNIDAEAGTDVVRSAVMRQLHELHRWLIVFDNVSDPGSLADWLPGGTGHVLITSKELGFHGLAVLQEVGVFSRDESITMLRSRIDGLSLEDASKLAGDLGDLPLCIAQAAEFIPQSGITTANYRQALERQASLILAEGRPTIYPISAAAAVELDVRKLADEDPVAAELASLCAFFAAAPIPQVLLTSFPQALPSILADHAVNSVLWAKMVVRMRAHNIVDVGRDGRLQLHRLIRAILRDRLEVDKASEMQASAEALLIANRPGDPGDPTMWARWADLLPHVLDADPADTDNSSLRSMACDACLYLLDKGDARGGHQLIDKLYQSWRVRLGENDPHTSTILDYRMRALREMGEFAEAKRLAEDTWARRRDQLGEDDFYTLTAASNLAADLSALGQIGEAKELEEGVFAKRQQLLGENHPDTLASASNLAIDLSRRGELGKALRLASGSWERRCGIQGVDHPDTLKTASTLAIILAESGDLDGARRLGEDILMRRRRVLGSDHPATLFSALNLADMRYLLGDTQSAMELGDDALPRLRRVLGSDHPHTLSCEAAVARYRREL